MNNTHHKSANNPVRTRLQAICCGLVLSLGVAAMNPTYAREGSVDASAQSLQISGLSMGFAAFGALTVVARATDLTVKSIKASGTAAGQLVELTLNSAALSATATVEVSAAALQSAGVAVGTVLHVSTINTGYLVVAPSGTVIGFAPNQQGAALLYRQRAL